jgi:hypothetical protein
MTKNHIKFRGAEEDLISSPHSPSSGLTIHRRFVKTLGLAKFTEQSCEEIHRRGGVEAARLGCRATLANPFYRDIV